MYLEKNGYVEGIILEDGDHFVLGASTMVTQLNYNSGRCCVVKYDNVHIKFYNSTYHENLP